MSATSSDPNDLLAEDMGRFFADPLGFVMYAYPWDTDPELQIVELAEPWASRYNSFYGPDIWACELLDEIGRQVREHGFVPGGPAVEAIREAIASGHGIGKSAMAGWLVDWIASTRPHSQGTVTANTATQLATKTWAQIVKWTKKCITVHWFTISASRGNMSIRHKAFPESWFCTAQTCDEENSEAFAGQHAASSTSYYIVDEGSKVPDKIYEVMDGGLTDGEPMQFVFGNPTQSSGRFHSFFHKLRHRWGTRQIDSRSVQITNKVFLQELIDDYGIDSDIVKIRVRGMFPAMSSLQFISTRDVDAAIARHLAPGAYSFAPKILTLDNAWEGDDEGVIGLRQGLRFQTLVTFSKNDNDIEVANKLAALEEEYEADAVFIDAGYGTGVYSAGKTMGRDWELVWFAGESPDPGCLNMRAWMWQQGKLWLKNGGALEARDQVLYSDLVNMQTVPRMDGKVQLEAKKDAKRRDIPSPGRGDAWALSFARPVAKKPRGLVAAVGALKPKSREHDPYALIGKE